MTKIKVTKIGVARSQLLEAINLYFEERDPVSIHTLTAASLQILNDHFPNKGDVWDGNFALHADSIYIKDEYRKDWIASLNKAKNFFKHADKDLKDGVTELEFETKLNDTYIFETVRRLQQVEGDAHIQEPEFKVFYAWMMANYPQWLKKDRKDIDDRMKKVTENLKTIGDFRKALLFMKNPAFETLINTFGKADG